MDTNPEQPNMQPNKNKKTGYESVNKDNWGAFFDFLSKLGKGQWVQLEVVGPEIGDQIEREWTEFEGVSYDSALDNLYLHMQGLEHEIHNPEEIVYQKNGMTKTIVVKDHGGLIQIMHFRDPLLLEGF